MINKNGDSKIRKHAVSHPSAMNFTSKGYRKTLIETLLEKIELHTCWHIFSKSYFSMYQCDRPLNSSFPTDIHLKNCIFHVLLHWISPICSRSARTVIICFLQFSFKALIYFLFFITENRFSVMEGICRVFPLVSSVFMNGPLISGEQAETPL